MSKNKKKENKSKKKNQIENTPVIDIEKNIINANRIMEEEKTQKIKPIINWIQSIINGLMLVFVFISFLFAWIFAEPVINNIKNGNWFNITNLLLLGDVIALILLGAYTFIANKHIDKISNINNITETPM